MQTKEDRALLDINNAWNELCPAVDKGFVWRLVAEMRADGTTNILQQIRVAVSRLYDGLAYGNWPSA
jgi:hypothetical protein